MKNKPEFKEQQKRKGSSDEPAFDGEVIFDERPDFGDYPVEVEFETAPIGVEGDPFAQGSAVGVNNSFDPMHDMFGQPDDADDLEDEDAYDYQLFSDEEHYGQLPRPDIFAAYPPEVQRKILEWTDRDIRARRDDESQRQDMILRARFERDRWRIAIPVLIVVLGVLCSAFMGVITKDPVITIAFLIIPLTVVIAVIVRASGSRRT